MKYPTSRIDCETNFYSILENFFSKWLYFSSKVHFCHAFRSGSAHQPFIYDELIEKSLTVNTFFAILDAHLGLFYTVSKGGTAIGFPASPTINLGSKKNPKIKNVRFLTNGASTCRDVECRLLDLKSMQNPLYFGGFSDGIGDNTVISPILGDVSAR